MINVKEFYWNTDVIKRILEYCGVPAEETNNFGIEDWAQRLFDSQNLRDMDPKMTVEYIAGWGNNLERVQGKKASSRFNWQLGQLLDLELNLFRSVWDKQKLTFLLDVEYVCKRFPKESYVNQEATFRKLEPYYKCLMDIFAEYKIKPMTLVTGQGYHFVFDINSYDRDFRDPGRKVTDVANKLVEIGSLEETLKGKYEFVPSNTKRPRRVTQELGRAYDTIGMLMEFIVHKTISRVCTYDETVPPTIGDVTIGNLMHESVNLDLSTYASPIFTRVMRTAFSVHDKHRDWSKDIGAGHIPVQITIPRYTPCNGNELELWEVFNNRRHFQNAANYAAAINTNVPQFNGQLMKLIKEYQSSKLAEFHRNFNSANSDAPWDWWQTYDKYDSRELPPCVSTALNDPNPALLQPNHLQALTRVLMKKGWPPAHIAGLVRSKYERNHGWELNWGKYDANRHSRAWVRWYAGLIIDGLDNKTDLNCVSYQERKLCTGAGCGYNLEGYK